VATKIRLARYGAKKKPFYRIVVADERQARDGRYIEILGHYDPKNGIEGADLKADRVHYWLGCGAQTTNTARNIIRKNLPKEVGIEE